MARSFILRQGEDQTPEYDLTDSSELLPGTPHVVWDEVEAGGRAFRGESNTSRVVMRDEQGETGSPADLPGGLTFHSVSRGSRWEWLDGPDGAEVRMAVGRIGVKDYSRARQKAERAREVSITCADANEELTQILIDDWVRPAETDIERVTALLADYLDGDPRPTTVLTDTYVSADDPVNLPAKTYDGTDPKGVLSDVALTANKNFFVTVDDELFYDGWTSEAYPAGLRVSDRPEEWTLEGATPASAIRLYPSLNVETGVSGLAADADWDGVLGNFFQLYTTPQSTRDGGLSTTTYDDYAFLRLSYPMDTAAAAMVAAGGAVVSGQFRTRMRSGIGIYEAGQDGISQIGVRVTQGASTTVRGTALPLHSLASSAGSVKWGPFSTYLNKTFPPAAADNVLAAVPGTVAGDRLVFELGYRNFTVISEPTGGGVWVCDVAGLGNDLPVDDSTSTNLNSWLQLGPAEDVALTVGPRWDVGPASTEDGLELLCGLRLYYGQDGAYVYLHDSTTHDQYWHAEKSFYTSDPVINDATKANVLAAAIHDRIKTEDRTYNLSVGPLYAEHVGLLKYGQLIDIKARAIPDADDQFQSRRIAQLRWTSPRPGVFWAHLQLDRPMKEQALGVGDKTSHDAIAAHKQGDSHPASAIVITDAGAYFSGNDVEAALQELAAGGGTTIDIEDEGSAEGTVSTLDFTGAGVSVTVTGSSAEVIIPGGGGGLDWDQTVNETGASATGWTAQNGTWSSTGSVIQNTDAGAANKWFRFNTKQVLGLPTIYEAEVKVVSGGGLAGIILGYNGATNTGGLFVGIGDTANKVAIEAPAAVAEVNSYATTITTGTFYKLRVIRGSGFASVYLDGTLLGSTEPVSLSGAVAPWDYIALRCHTAAAEFRNIKLWTLSTGLPA